MISIGRSIRWYNDYMEEVDFSIKNNFDFMQIWYKDGDIVLENISEPKIEYVKKAKFPVIIHAVFDPVDFETYGGDLINKVKYLGMNEVIIHPVSEKSQVTDNTQFELVKQVQNFSEKAKKNGLIWYLENNSIIDEFHYKPSDISTVFQNDVYVEQLLDVAHIDNYDHLQSIIDIKFPKCLHIAGKHFAIPHEHLPLTQGDIDYNLVFKKYLPNFDGRIILEVVDCDEEIIASKEIIDEVMCVK